MSVKSFLIYFYFRVYELYKGPARSEGPVVFVIGLNFSTVVNLGLLIFSLVVPFSPLKPLIPSMIVADGVSLLITLCLVEVYLYRNRRLIGKHFEQFKKETNIERRRNTRKMWLYIGTSILALVVSYMLS